MGLAPATAAVGTLSVYFDTRAAAADAASNGEAKSVTADVLAAAACGSPQARALLPHFFCRAVDFRNNESALSILSAALAPSLAARAATGVRCALDPAWTPAVVLRASFLAALGGDRDLLYSLLIATRPVTGYPTLGVARRLRTYVLAAAVAASATRGSCLGQFECGALAPTSVTGAEQSDATCTGSEDSATALLPSSFQRSSDDAEAEWVDEAEEVLHFIQRLPDAPNVIEVEFLIAQHRYSDAHEVVSSMVTKTPEQAHWAAALASWLVALSGA
jgi:hypothetical protein